MPPKPKSKNRTHTKSKSLTVTLLFILVLAIAGGVLYWRGLAEAPNGPAITDADSPAIPAADSPAVPTAAKITVKKQRIIDIDTAKQNPSVKAEMEKRKEQYGVQDAVDAIIKPNESFQVGDKTVSMQKIADEIRLKEGDVIEGGIEDSTPEAKASKQTDYGIYVVQSGDNIWNLHFRFLMDYFKKRGVNLSPVADEPLEKGISSGVGKLLKFSENKVYIYNLRKERFDKDINLIHPNDKVVIYNMKRIFDLLDHIDYKQVERIQFDGEMLWIPSVEG